MQDCKYYTLKNCFGLVSEATNYMQVVNSHELGDALARAATESIPVVPIGGASNVILPRKWQCLCIHIAMEDIEVTEQDDAVLLRVGGGKNWHELVAHCVEQGFNGLENLALIPGTAGAAPIQNIGAYGTELQEFLVSVELVEIETGSRYTIDASSCGLAYRTSKFKHEWRDKFIITHINLKLHTQPKVNIKYESLRKSLQAKHHGDISPKDVFNEVVALRQKILPDPQVNGNVGSFFHNPVVSAEHFTRVQNKFKDIKGYELGDGQVRVAAASVLEALGFKGYQKNSVAMSSQHSLCMINLGNGTQEDVLALAAEIQAKVKDEVSIDLSIEPRIYR